MTDPGVTGPVLAAATAHLHADAVAALTAYRPVDAAQERLRADYLAHLAGHPDALAKGGPPEHLTASCLVLDEDGAHALLTLHRRAHRWFQFGGHPEPADATLLGAATREAREESGLAAVTPRPDIVELNRHALVGSFGRCREHLDVRFVAQVPRSSTPVVSNESHDVRWWPVADLPQEPDSDLTALVSAARRHLGLRALD